MEEGCARRPVKAKAAKDDVTDFNDGLINKHDSSDLTLGLSTFLFLEHIEVCVCELPFRTAINCTLRRQFTYNIRHEPCPLINKR